MPPNSTCPKCGTPHVSAQPTCDTCGLVFAKYYKYHPQPNISPLDEKFENPNQEKIINFRTLLLPSSRDSRDTSELLAKGILLLILLSLTLQMIFAGKTGQTGISDLLHLPNLVFHEAGHKIFGFFGDFIGSLGGTLGQLLMPAICVYVFLIHQRDPYAASICFWWFSENFIDIAPYINDASKGILPLLGGNTGNHSPYGFHDWEYLLTETGLIRYDSQIAQLSYLLGCLLMLAAVVWGGLILHRHHQAGKS